MLLHQRNKVFRGKSRQGRLGEVRILAEKVLRLRSHIGEVAAAAAGDQNLPTHALAVLQQQNATSALAGLERTHHSGRTRAQHHYIERIHLLILWNPTQSGPPASNAVEEI